MPVERADDAAGSQVTASHDGYAAEFRVTHQRELRLAGDGTVLDGVDTFNAVGAVDPEHRYALRFHLHPGLRASLIRGGSAVLLVCRDGEAWEFEAPGNEVTLEESIYLSDVYGHRKADQIVINGPRSWKRPSVSWQFRKTATAKLSRRGTSDFDEVEELPLEE